MTSALAPIKKLDTIGDRVILSVSLEYYQQMSRDIRPMRKVATTAKKSYEQYAHEINTLCDQIDRGGVETYGLFEGRQATDFLRQFI